VLRLGVGSSPAPQLPAQPEWRTHASVHAQEPDPGRPTAFRGRYPELGARNPSLAPIRDRAVRPAARRRLRTRGCRRRPALPRGRAGLTNADRLFEAPVIVEDPRKRLKPKPRPSRSRSRRSGSGLDPAREGRNGRTPAVSDAGVLATATSSGSERQPIVSPRARTVVPRHSVSLSRSALSEELPPADAFERLSLRSQSTISTPPAGRRLVQCGC
jgi:hypothetical protein